MPTGDSTPDPIRLLVTGASGFLGRVLVHELLTAASALSWRVKEVRAFDVVDFHEAARRDGRDHLRGLGEARVTPLRADLRDRAAVRAACQGVDVVLHAGSLVDWGHASDADLEAVNVAGTRNVIDGCLDAGVKALVYTSTEDVVFNGRPIRDADESHPYPTRFVNSYCRTKALGEQAVLAADTRQGAHGRQLHTVALRPVGIWGEGDPYHLGSLIGLARRGRLVRIGNGSARCQHVYVHNVAHAHRVAAAALLASPPTAHGRAYFVTDSAPANFFDYLAPVIEGAGYSVASLRWGLPRTPLWLAGALADAVAFGLRPLVELHPRLSRFAVTYITQDFTFRGDRAAAELGYAPIVPEAEARARTIAWYRARRDTP
jgi:sterol-4alpha-carboxylate 3-dehydrogenase (decarboxylating)